MDDAQRAYEALAFDGWVPGDDCPFGDVWILGLHRVNAESTLTYVERHRLSRHDVILGWKRSDTLYPYCPVDVRTALLEKYKQSHKPDILRGRIRRAWCTATMILISKVHAWAHERLK